MKLIKRLSKKLILNIVSFILTLVYLFLICYFATIPGEKTDFGNFLLIVLVIALIINICLPMTNSLRFMKVIQVIIATLFAIFYASLIAISSNLISPSAFKDRSIPDLKLLLVMIVIITIAAWTIYFFIAKRELKQIGLHDSSVLLLTELESSLGSLLTFFGLYELVFNDSCNLPYIQIYVTYFVLYLLPIIKGYKYVSEINIQYGKGKAVKSKSIDL